MHLLCVTDIHGKQRGIERLTKEAPSCDLLVVAGDITDFGGREEARVILDGLLEISEELVAVPGNCDYNGVNEFLAESQLGLHGSARVIKDFGFLGVGGSNITPFNTAQEYSEDDISGLLKNAYQALKEQGETILISHAPAYATKVDKTGMGLHVGSRSVRNFVDEYQPKVVISGHVHEARGMDTLGKSTLVNPGPLHMGYAMITLDEDVEVKFVTF
ncbi:MAG: metallophosphoesterase [Candidatus Hydrothermarchaeales archaeon]